MKYDKIIKKLESIEYLATNRMFKYRQLPLIEGITASNDWYDVKKVIQEVKIIFEKLKKNESI